MSMWYKNVRVYQLTKDIALVEELLQQKLAEFTFTPCHSQQPESLGWTSPILDEELLYHKQGQTIGLKLKIQQRILPSPVIREALEEKIKQKQADEGRRVFSREKRQLKDEIIEQLLPRSFTRSQYIKGFWDLKNNRLVIDVSSASKAEKFIKVLRETLGSLPLIPFEAKASPTATMTHWLQNGLDDHDLFLANECELRSTDEEAAIVRIKNQELSANEVMAHLEAGKQAVKVRVNWKDAVEATITEEGGFSRIKFSPAIKELDTEYSKEEEMARLSHEFSVMVIELNAFIEHMIEALGGQQINAHLAKD
ncbi:MAG: hypothetical protein COW84_12110 [Gammaproteobacteria bacterium CG22_combo_CG10-13_8_21_14_all_40_8]|nr:MAG: hypothetical protein COW84_12110 [Gammaproteobacteria bacterium CG22_combo_CG10-13_8_21_14_all_40_8]